MYPASHERTVNAVPRNRTRLTFVAITRTSRDIDAPHGPICPSPWTVVTPLPEPRTFRRQLEIVGETYGSQGGGSLPLANAGDCGQRGDHLSMWRKSAAHPPGGRVGGALQAVWRPADGEPAA